jgi:hypothetical protein
MEVLNMKKTISFLTLFFFLHCTEAKLDENIQLLHFYRLLSVSGSAGSGAGIGTSTGNGTGATTPLGLRIFVTTTSFQGNFEATTGAGDASCNADANKPSTGTYKVLRYGRAGILKANTDYYQSGGIKKIATTDAVGKIPDILLNSINNTTTTGSYVWYGSATASCINWQSASSNAAGTVGYSTSITSIWYSYDYSYNYCSNSFKLYCVEQPSDTTDYTISVTISGQTGTGLVLQNNGGDDLTSDASGTYSFPTKIRKGFNYNLSIKKHAGSNFCTITNGSGIANADTNVSVSCVARYRIFVTSSIFTGNLGGFTSADTSCNSDANKTTSATYKALLYGRTGILKVSTDYYQSGSITKIATTDATGKLPDNLLNSIDNTTQTGSYVWYGSATTSCTNWLSASSGVYGIVGYSTSITSNWYSYSTSYNLCSNSFSLYCVEQ